MTTWSWRGSSIVNSTVAIAAVLMAGVAVLGTDALQATRVALLAVVVAALIPLCCSLARRRHTVRTVLVGDRVSVAALAATWKSEPRMALTAACIMEPDLDADLVPPHILGVTTLPSLDDLSLVIEEQQVDAVVVAPSPSWSPDDFRGLAWQLESTRATLSVVSTLDSALPSRITTSAVRGKVVHEVAPPRAATVTRLTKSAIDRLAGFVLLAVAAPVLAILVAAIRLNSPGPGLFRQQRVGRRRRPFTLYKLRTMRNDAEGVKESLVSSNEAGGVLFKIKDDPRITSIGRLLRKTSLDELPQLINVVKGDMSLVGPRPALPEEVAQYDAAMGRRLTVKPGMTGLWQVSGRSDLPGEQATRLDLLYTDNVGIAQDLKIALRTLDAVAHSRGAY